MRSAPALAQLGFKQTFREGAVILTSGDTVRGSFDVYQGADAIRVVLPNNTVKTFSAAAVKLFAVTGEQLKRFATPFMQPVPAVGRSDYNPQAAGLPGPRRSISVQPPQLPIDTNQVRLFRQYLWDRDHKYNGHRSPAFFEQLTNGPVLLVRRQRLTQFSVWSNGINSWQYPITYDRHFLVFPDGRLVSFRNTRKHFLALFRADASAIKAFAQDNRLNFQNSRSLAILVTYANSLHTAATPSQSTGAAAQK